jgi:hypothetical protein
MKKVSLIIVTLLILLITAFAADKAAETVDSAHEDAGLTCDECHDEGNPVKRAAAANCIECHSDKRDEAPIAFKDDTGISYEVNPHSSHAGNMRCTLCHRIHTQSVLFCNEGCHHKFLLTVP